MDAVVRHRALHIRISSLCQLPRGIYIYMNCEDLHKLGRSMRMIRTAAKIWAEAYRTDRERNKLFGTHGHVG